VPEPTAELAGLRAATARLLDDLGAQDWTADDVAAPSLCAGWTRGHILTHIARNADGISDTLAGALRGEIVPRYPRGWDARNAAIEAGAARSPQSLLADVGESAERLDRTFAAVGDARAWERPTEHDDPAHVWAFRRWREVAVHHVDLDCGYLPDQWPAPLVAAVLPEAAATLAERAGGPLRVTVTADGSVAAEDVGLTWTVGTGEPVEVTGPDWAVLAWLTGRVRAAGDALTATPELGPWR
jgi:maleylpyruvate isomerase